MTKKQARKIALNYLFNAGHAFTDNMFKITIDDRGTQSEFGYTYEDCEVIQQQVDWLTKKLLQYEPNIN